MRNDKQLISNQKIRRRMKIRYSLDSVVTRYFPKQPGIWSEQQQEMKTNFCNIWLQRLANVSDVKMRFRLTFWFYILFCRNFLWIFRFFRGGITTFISKLSAVLTILLLSYARSAISPRAPTFSTSSPAFAQSAVTSSVTTHRTGTPRASPARCILVLSPPFVRAIPRFPPRAPQACACAFT